jgi:hypothetical protein
MMLQAGVCPAADCVLLEGEKIQVVSKVKYLELALDANGATAESLRGTVRPATARLMESMDAGALVRDMRPAGAAHYYDTFVSSMWRRVSDTNITSQYDDNQRPGLPVFDLSAGKDQVHRRECQHSAPLLRLDSPMRYKRIQAHRLIRTLLNVTAGDESGVVRDRTKRTLDSARQIPFFQGMVMPFTDPATYAELQTWRLDD